MTEVSRRAFLGRAELTAGGIAAGGASLGLMAACIDTGDRQRDSPPAVTLDPQDWECVREQFALRCDWRDGNVR